MDRDGQSTSINKTFGFCEQWVVRFDCPFLFGQNNLLNLTFMNKNEPKEKSIYSWEISDEELKNQIENYNHLGMLKSYRKISSILVLWLIISAIASLYLGFFEAPLLILPVLIFYILLFYFVYKGHRWSIIVLMMIFTVEIIFKEINGFIALDKVKFFPIVWWFIVVPVLFKALKVENERKKKIQNTNANNNTKPQITKIKIIFCQKCGKKNINEANYCKKCGNKIIK